jgi:addiction module HigA family antidote
MPRRRFSHGTVQVRGQFGPVPPDSTRSRAGQPTSVRWTHNALLDKPASAADQAPREDWSVAACHARGDVFEILDAEGQVLDLPQAEADAFIEHARASASRKVYSTLIEHKIRQMEQDPTTPPEDLRNYRYVLLFYRDGLEAALAAMEADWSPPPPPDSPTAADRQRHAHVLQHQTTAKTRRWRRPPPHPAQILLDKYLRPRGWSVEQAAEALGFHPRPLQELLNDRGDLLPLWADRLARVFGTTEEYWHALQQDYDAWHAAQEEPAPASPPPRRRRREPPHPGEILQRQYLTPRGLTEAQVQAQLQLSRLQVQDLLAARTPVTAPLALKLARVFGTKPQLWLNLQQAYDLYHAALQEEL